MPKSKTSAQMAKHVAGVRVKVATTVKMCREARDLTQVALASSSHVARRNLQRIETGEQSPTVDTLVALADAMDMAPSTLLP